MQTDFENVMLHSFSFFAYVYLFIVHNRTILTNQPVLHRETTSCQVSSRSLKTNVMKTFYLYYVDRKCPMLCSNLPTSLCCNHESIDKRYNSSFVKTEFLVIFRLVSIHLIAVLFVTFISNETKI